jgi:iron complex transport system substrate-binding protein
VAWCWRAAAAALLLLAACDARGDDGAEAGEQPAPDSVAVHAVDDEGREVRLARPARRVVSLVPSATDIAVAVGAAGQLAARTRYDVRPELAHLPSVGGGIDPSLETLVATRPDLVVLWAQEQRSALRAQLEEAGIATFALRTTDTTDVFAAIARLGHLLGRDGPALRVAATVRGELDAVRRSVAGRPTRTVFYVVGSAPPMTAGPQTFVGQLVGVAGGRTAFPDVAQPWPTVAIEEIVRRQPDVVILPVSDAPTTSVAALRDAAGWRELRAVREGRVVTVPADVFGRPGPRMGEAARLLRDALHPE